MTYKSVVCYLFRPLILNLLIFPNQKEKYNHRLYLLYLSTSFLWWQAVAGIIGVKSSHALRMNSRCTWRHREGSRNVYNTAIRRALSPLRPCGSVHTDGHGCPRGVAPIRHPIAIRDTPVAHTGGETTPSPHKSTRCDTRPSILFSPPGHGFSTLDARWKLLIGQYTSGIIRGDTVGIREKPPFIEEVFMVMIN